MYTVRAARTRSPRRLRYMHVLRCRHTQGCGVGLDVSVSRRSRDVLTYRSRLEKNCQRLGLVRQTSRSRLGLGYLRLVPKTSFWPNCAGHINESFATNSAARNGVVKTQTGSNSGSDILPRDP